MGNDSCLPALSDTQNEAQPTIDADCYWRVDLEESTSELREGKETEMVKALAFLDQKIDALQKYLATAAPIITAAGTEAKR